MNMDGRKVVVFGDCPDKEIIKAIISYSEQLILQKQHIDKNIIKLDEFDLARLDLTEEQKDELKQLNIPMDALLTILNGLPNEKPNHPLDDMLKGFIHNPEPIKENKKTWKKNKFWER